MNTVKNKRDFKAAVIGSDLYAEKRLVFQTGTSPATTAEIAKGQEAAEEWKKIQAKAGFSPQTMETFRNLAKSAFPNDEKQQTEYAQRINDSLVNHLAPGRTMDGLWKYLLAQNCSMVAIIEGFLNFFRTGKTGDEKINIEDFFNIGVFSAEYPEDRQYAELRNTEINKTKTALASLLAEIQGANPNLPKPTI